MEGEMGGVYKGEGNYFFIYFLSINIMYDTFIPNISHDRYNKILPFCNMG